MTIEGYNISITVIDNNFIVVLPEEMNNVTIGKIESMVTEKAYQNEINGAILNFSMVSVMDTYTYRAFERITDVFSLMGIHTVWVGLRPGVVSGLMDLDIAVNLKIKMALNLELGLVLIDRDR
ncbi:STAS domain-containing protein [Acetobacterium tundrae]|uniref:STAS domain-containing protein n=1 Tax=Acetobacterium tundrae TaxID=132932 RepID=A0ABR6WLY1_9FIRM|nr:STAS domain-containing protein [Acetobacterium tundrae]MBC3797520.1 STAS domain-containing protein [Acetobacterium tundrae]